MQDQKSYDYALIRVTPRVEREEFINSGVILFCRERKFLKACIHVDEARLKALWPEIDIDEVRQHLEAFPRICSGDSSAGPVAQLSLSERFHWLVAPRSTILQTSPVHSGLCEDPESEIERLARELLHGSGKTAGKRPVKP